MGDMRDGEIRQATALTAGRAYRAVLIRAGEWWGKGMRARPEVLRAAAAKFDGLASFLNPPPPRAGEHGYPPLERLVGAVENPRWDEAAGGIVAEYRLAVTPAAEWVGRLIDGWLAAREMGRRVPEIGLSAVPWVRLGPAGPDGVRDVEEVVRVEQVDIVYRPAAGGAFERALMGADGVQMGAAWEGGDASGNERVELVAEWDRDAFIREEGTMSETEQAPAGERPATRVEAVDPAGTGVAELLAAQRAVGTEAAELLAAQRAAVLEARLAASGLPAGFQGLVREGLPQGWRLADLDASVGRVQRAWADEESRRTVQGVRPAIGGMRDGADRMTEALTALLEGRRPRDGVPPLSGIREAYLLLSGDYEMTGLFHEERVTLANVNSTTMANMVANVMNKVVVSEFQQYPRWWEPVVRREGFNSLQQVKWVVLGGVGELPLVGEGAAYSELAWDDAGQTSDWQKRGGYLGITLEAMDKDDVTRLRTAPRALAQAAWLTLGRSVAALFTQASGAGPTLSDGVALFHAGHSNVGTTALATASWQAARLAMRKQSEVNSGERLGALTSPRFLLVPPDLENTALTVLASEQVPGGAANDVNPEAEGNTFDARMAAARRRIIVVDLWTDTNDWAAAADPRLYPTVGLGFRYGETPEIFSVASPASGLMFTNDVMPVKVRWFYAVGPMDYRGLWKSNVA